MSEPVQSEYRIESYTLSDMIEALRAAQRSTERDRMLPFDYVHRLSALIVALGTLARDISLLDWLDSKAVQTYYRGYVGPDEVQYMWSVTQSIRVGPNGEVAKRQHLRQILSDIRDSNYPNAKKIQYLQTRIDTEKR